MIRNVVVALLLVAALLVVARWVRERRSPEGWVEAAELRRLLADPGQALVVDVRGPDEFTGPLGHIHGAQNIPLDQVEGRADELAARALRPLVLVCQTDRRSASAAQLLRDRGVDDVLVLREGMVGWNREGFAVERDAPEASR